MEYRLPLSSSIVFGRSDFHDKLRQAVSLGYQYIDFDISGAWKHPWKERRTYRHLEQGMDAVNESGLKVNAIHISFGTQWDPSEIKDSRRKKIVKRIISIIKRTEAVHPFCYVLHGSFEPIPDSIREKKINALISSLTDICAATKRFICVETLPRTCLMNTAKETKNILDRANIDNLRVCLDVNHFLQEKPEDAILLLGDRIATLHISDYDGVDERHWLPGKGIIDWNAVLSALEKVGYNGAFNYEVSESLAEIKENHAKLFSGTAIF